MPDSSRARANVLSRAVTLLCMHAGPARLKFVPSIVSSELPRFHVSIARVLPTSANFATEAAHATPRARACSPTSSACARTAALRTAPSMSASARDPPSATSGAERAVESNTQHAAVAPSHALVLAQSAARPAAVTAETSRALAAPLAQSVARSRISSAPTLLPSRLAQLVTALSLAARVSLRASALFIEAILETLRHGTVTGLGVTRRALIAAVGSARALHYVKNGLDWSGRDEEGNRIE